MTTPSEGLLDQDAWIRSLTPGMRVFDRQRRVRVIASVRDVEAVTAGLGLAAGCLAVFGFESLAVKLTEKLMPQGYKEVVARVVVFEDGIEYPALACSPVHEH